MQSVHRAGKAQNAQFMKILLESLFELLQSQIQIGNCNRRLVCHPVEFLRRIPVLGGGGGGGRGFALRLLLALRFVCDPVTLGVRCFQRRGASIARGRVVITRGLTFKCQVPVSALPSTLRLSQNCEQILKPADQLHNPSCDWRYHQILACSVFRETQAAPRHGLPGGPADA